MRILDENGNEVLNPDYSLGCGVEEVIVIAHHEAQEFAPDVFHYETAREHKDKNGHVTGSDVVRVIDIPGHDASEAWDETELILRWRWYTPEEIEEMESDISGEEALRIILGIDQ